MKRVLICDDEPHIVEGLRYLLRSPSRQIETACNGLEALERIRSSLRDLLIVDVMMPQMGGLEVVAALQASPDTQDLPIIILTAKGQARDAAIAQETWGALVMAKPFEPKKLRELVNSILEDRTCPARSST